MKSTTSFIQLLVLSYHSTNSLAHTQRKQSVTAALFRHSDVVNEAKSYTYIYNDQWSPQYRFLVTKLLKIFFRLWVKSKSKNNLSLLLNGCLILVDSSLPPHNSIYSFLNITW